MVQHRGVGESHTANDDIPTDKLRLTVPDAARVLGISPEAVRNRLSRGTLESVKEQGTVYVLIYRDMVRHTADIPIDRPGESDALISEMRGRIDSLERQLEQANERDRENRRIIAALTNRIPQLEAPSGPRESPETAAVQGTGHHPGGVQEGAQRPWWRKLIGG
jgi:hypothetical protein